MVEPVETPPVVEPSRVVEPVETSTRYRRFRSTATARSSTASGVPSTVKVRDSGSRERFRGARGGRARIARQ